LPISNFLKTEEKEGSGSDFDEKELRIEPIYLVCGDNQDFFFTCKDRKK
jgi:hypothetical protein